jgi:hypothetical protein
VLRSKNDTLPIILLEMGGAQKNRAPYSFKSFLSIFLISFQMSNNVEHQTIISNKEIFTIDFYDSISVMTKESDKHINGTVMCKIFNRRFFKIKGKRMTTVVWNVYEGI